MKTKVCLKCFVHNCLRKQFFASKFPQRPSNLISFTIFVTLMPLAPFQPKIQAKKFEKVDKICFLANCFSDPFTEVFKFGIEIISSLF